MKLRIKGNSIRFRVARSELTKLIEEGRIEETIYFTPSEQGRLTYALEQSDLPETRLRYEGSEVTIALPRELAATWAGSDQVGIYDSIDLARNGLLTIAVEKDFACLDRSDSDNVDTFENPLAGANC
jgi:hypothetical protein